MATTGQTVWNWIKDSAAVIVLIAVSVGVFFYVRYESNRTRETMKEQMASAPKGVSAEDLKTAVAQELAKAAPKATTQPTTMPAATTQPATLGEIEVVNARMVQDFEDERAAYEKKLKEQQVEAEIRLKAAEERNLASKMEIAELESQRRSHWEGRMGAIGSGPSTMRTAPMPAAPSTPPATMPSSDEAKMFLKPAMLRVKGEDSAKQRYLVCIPMPGSSKGDVAYVGPVKPNVELPPGTDLIRVEIEAAIGSDRWITAWVVVSKC